MRYTVTSLLCLTALTWNVWASPIDHLEQRAATDALAHGNYFQFNGRVWRYYEMSPGNYMGYTPEEWPADGQPQLSTVPTTRSIVSRHDVAERDLNNVCSNVLTCAANTAIGFAGAICTGAGYAIDFMKNNYPTATSIGEFLDRPFVATFVGVGGQNALVTWVFSETKNSGANVPPESCSTQNTESDLVQSMLKNLCKLESNNANGGELSMTLPDGSTFTISINVGNGSTVGGTQVCGAPGIQ